MGPVTDRRPVARVTGGGRGMGLASKEVAGFGICVTRREMRPGGLEPTNALTRYS